jgi:ribosomal protein L15
VAHAPEEGLSGEGESGVVGSKKGFGDGIEGGEGMEGVEGKVTPPRFYHVEAG